MAIKKTKKTPRKTAKKSTSKKTTTKKLAAKKIVVKKRTTNKKVAKQTYQGEEAFLASIKPYKLNKKEKYMSAKQKRLFAKII